LPTCRNHYPLIIRDIAHTVNAVNTIIPRIDPPFRLFIGLSKNNTLLTRDRIKTAMQQIKNHVIVSSQHS